MINMLQWIVLESTFRRDTRVSPCYSATKRNGICIILAAGIATYLTPETIYFLQQIIRRCVSDEGLLGRLLTLMAKPSCLFYMENKNKLSRDTIAESNSISGHLCLSWVAISSAKTFQCTTSLKQCNGFQRKLLSLSFRLSSFNPRLTSKYEHLDLYNPYSIEDWNSTPLKTKSGYWKIIIFSPTNNITKTTCFNENTIIAP